MKIVSIEKFANIVDWNYWYQLFLKISESLPFKFQRSR